MWAFRKKWLNREMYEQMTQDTTANKGAIHSNQQTKPSMHGLFTSTSTFSLNLCQRRDSWTVRISTHSLHLLYFKEFIFNSGLKQNVRMLCHFNCQPSDTVKSVINLQFSYQHVTWLMASWLDLQVKPSELTQDLSWICHRRLRLNSSLFSVMWYQ